MRLVKAGLFVGTLGLAGAAHAAPDCAGMAKLKLANVAIASAVAVPAGSTPPARPGQPPIAAKLPAFCKVTGTILPRTGAAGAKLGLRFELALPADWNGRFLFQGGGGLNGTLNPALGVQATGDTPALARGFAVVSTDGGHTGTGFGQDFMVDQQAALDFAFEAVPTVTPVAKQLVESFYGKPAHHSYFVGCSTGGREAMQQASRFPSLFDGIVAGAPAMRTGYSNIATSRLTVMLNQAAAKDATGKPTPLFTAADKTTIVNGLLAACDAEDGLKDGVIAHATQCRFQPASIACSAAKTGGCLTPAQVRALEAAFQPTRDSSGYLIYPAFPWDTGIVAERGIPGVLTTGTPSPLGPPNLDLAIDIDARSRTAREDPVQALIDTDRWTNLSSFIGHGGKIIFYHGASDPWFSANDTIDWVARAEQTNGADGWANSGRLYLVPGAGHCGGGANTFDQFDLLSPVVAWVERNQAPQSIPARRTAPTPASRPLCPYPSYPFYRGGDAALAESFECRKS